MHNRADIALVATDLDGTLLRSDGSLGERTRAAVSAAREHGLAVVPVTARQPMGLRHLVSQTDGWSGFGEWAVCSNGALGIRLDTDDVLFETLVEIPTLEHVVTQLQARVPGVRIASVGSRGHRFLAGPGYVDVTVFDDHKRDPASMESVSLPELMSQACLKLCVRQPGTAPAATLATIEALDLPGIQATRSGAPFVEISAAGVTKAAGVARLCAGLGIDRAQVIAVGDAPNDIAMLEWAGRGVAMGNAEDGVKAAADVVIGSNDEEAVAALLERLHRKTDLLVDRE